MATAVQKITLSSSRDIPFNKLVLSQSNVRRVKAGISIEDLAASIARRGLIQMVSKRKKLLKYLESKDFDAYQAIIAKLGLRK